MPETFGFLSLLPKIIGGDRCQTMQWSKPQLRIQNMNMDSSAEEIASPVGY
jgi:hypothetical protein